MGVFDKLFGGSGGGREGIDAAMGAGQQQMPPPPPPVELPADPPKQADDAVKQAAEDAKTKARAAAGMASTDVTKGGLVTTAAPTAAKKALGE